MLNEMQQQRQCFWKCNIDGSLDQPEYYLNMADCQCKMGQNLRRGYTWIGVKFEVMLRGIVRNKMGWKHYQTVDHPKKEPQVGRGLFVNCLLLYCSVRALWLARLLSGHYFLVMTRHYEIFSRFNASFELWVKLRARGRKQQKRWTKYNYIFNNWKKN